MEFGSNVRPAWTSAIALIALTLGCGAVAWNQEAAAQENGLLQGERADQQNDAQDDEAPEGEDDQQRGRRRGRGRRGWFPRTPSWQLTDGRDVRAAFREVVSSATKSMVCVHCDGSHAILGCVVGSDGWVLTKASVLSGELTVHNADNDEFPAVLVASDKEYDLALLKAEGIESIPSLELADVATPQVGAWLATVGKTENPVAVGVVSVPPREIRHQAGVLGVRLEDPEAEEGQDRPIVGQVFPDSAAEDAGIQINDLIVRVNDKQVDTREQLVRSVRSHSPGDVVTIIVRREGEELEFSARLGSDFPLDVGDRDQVQNMMGGKLSDRRFGFPEAFQHDTVLRPIDCGGPVVNLNGQVVGFNVARAGRTESYAVDVATVRGLLKTWMNQPATEQVKTDVDAPPADEDAPASAPVQAVEIEADSTPVQ